MDVPRRLCALALFCLLAATAAQVQAAPSAAPAQKYAPTYRILATREGLVGKYTANGHMIQQRDRFVALPSWSVLAKKGGSEFQVRLTYKGRSVVAPVWDVGPWNTQDDYWSSKRRYSDLPVGMPMAYAAFFHNYNGGLDEFGRRIESPNGIDIADGTFWDDLQMTRSDYVDVTYLWLGEDPGPGNAVPIVPPDPPPAAQPAPPAAPVKRQPAAPPPPVEEGATAIDNGAAGYTANGGKWFSAECGVGGSHSWTYSTADAATGTNLASWTAALPAKGFYEVKVFVPACGEVGATRAARYRITSDGGVSEVALDQQANAGKWASLGTFSYMSDTPPQVELADVAGDNRRAVRYDAVAWAPRSDTTPPDATSKAITRQGNGYLIELGGTDDISGIASYDIQVRQLPSGGWTDWKRGIVEPAVWFGPDEGNHFAFRVRGRDRAGNEEPWPPEADRDTTCAGRSEPRTACGP